MTIIPNSCSRKGKTDGQKIQRAGGKDVSGKPYSGKGIGEGMMTEMLLSEIRQAVGLTQEELASALEVKQPTLSRMESQGDMQISTLRRLVRALGGEVDIVVRLPQGQICLTQFDNAALLHR